MTREEVLRAIEKAKAAIDAYRRENLQKAALESQKHEITKIEKASRDLLKSIDEAYMMGPAGEVCPYCNGSGRR